MQPPPGASRKPPGGEFVEISALFLSLYLSIYLSLPLSPSLCLCFFCASLARSLATSVSAFASAPSVPLSLYSTSLPEREFPRGPVKIIVAYKGNGGGPVCHPFNGLAVSAHSCSYHAYKDIPAKKQHLLRSCCFSCRLLSHLFYVLFPFQRLFRYIAEQWEIHFEK
jgi:hypothetical protein